MISLGRHDGVMAGTEQRISRQSGFNFAFREPFLRHFQFNFAVPKAELGMCRLCCSLGSLSTFVVICPGAAYAGPMFNLYIVAHDGLDHTQVTYRTSRCPSAFPSR